MNHRGGKQTDYQTKVLNKIKNKESMYYLKFYGYLEDFVRTINQNFNSSLTYVKNITNNDQTTNTLGHISPVLSKLSETLKKEKK